MCCHMLAQNTSHLEVQRCAWSHLSLALKVKLKMLKWGNVSCVHRSYSTQACHPACQAHGKSSQTRAKYYWFMMESWKRKRWDWSDLSTPISITSRLLRNHISAFDILDWYVQGYVWTSRAKKCPRFPIVPPPYNAYPPFPPPAARCGWGWLSRSSSLPCRVYSAECTAVQPTQLNNCTLHWEHKSNNRFPPHSTPPSS